MPFGSLQGRGQSWQNPTTSIHSEVRAESLSTVEFRRKRRMSRKAGAQEQDRNAMPPEVRKDLFGSDDAMLVRRQAVAP
jgi:hypothetical protein